MIDLVNKRILVTGASSGIGRTIAQCAASFGARLILIGRNAERLEETLDSLVGVGHEYFSADVTNYDLMEQIIRSSVSSGGQMNGFVHSAGIEITALLKASSPDLIKEIFETNVFAGFEIARIITKKNIIDKSGGSIVFISSVMGKLGEPGKLAYSSSKSALLSGSKSIALELAHKNIRCNCVLPGVVQTEMTENLFRSIPTESRDKIIGKHPLGLGKPEDVGYLVSFLLSDYARWITGSEYIIDGGYSAQ